MRYFQWLVIGLGLISLTACGASAARYNNRGNENFEAGEYQAALEQYTAARLENPDLAEPYYNGGNTWSWPCASRSSSNNSSSSNRAAVARAISSSRTRATSRVSSPNKASRARTIRGRASRSRTILKVPVGKTSNRTSSPPPAGAN